SFGRIDESRIWSLCVMAMPVAVLEVRFPALLLRGKIADMDVQQSNRAPIAFRESCRVALYTILLLASPLATYYALSFIVWLAVDVYYYRWNYCYEWRMWAACFVGAGAILSLVRWLNHREVPRRVNSPSVSEDVPQAIGRLVTP